MTTTLSPSQAKAEQMFLDFLQNGEKEMVITGFAGSGKSYLVKHLYDVAQSYAKLSNALFKSVEANRNIFFTATTNKAASVLKDFMGLQTSTIHKFLGLRMNNDLKTGKEKLITTDRTMTHSNIILFVDEASLVNDALRKLILKYTAGNSKIIYVGDRYQLASVGNKEASVFVENIPSTIHLKEIQRQAQGNSIIQVSGIFRDILDQGIKPAPWPQIPANNVDIIQVDGATFGNLVDAKFQGMSFGNNECRILAYNNRKVINYNNHIRKLNALPEQLTANELVMTNKPIIIGGVVVHPTDDTLRIGYTTPVVSDEGIEGQNVQLPCGQSIFVPNNQEIALDWQKYYARKKDWQNYFKVKEQYADLRPAYAMTCHKAQGSTYREVFVDLSNIATNTKWYEISRMVYVAITRASEKVYLYGDLNRKK